MPYLVEPLPRASLPVVFEGLEELDFLILETAFLAASSGEPLDLEPSTSFINLFLCATEELSFELVREPLMINMAPRSTTAAAIP